eukprot:20001_2
MPKLGLIILNWGILQATGRPETMSTRESRVGGGYVAACVWDHAVSVCTSSKHDKSTIILFWSHNRRRSILSQVGLVRQWR